MSVKSIMARGGYPAEQQHLDLEYERFKQQNLACRGQWLIPPITQCLVYLMACQYQRLHAIEPLEKFVYIRTKVKDLLACYASKNKKYGKNQRLKVEDLVKTATNGKIILYYENGDMEAAAIFEGRTYYHKDTDEIAACFSNDMQDIYIKLSKDNPYTWFDVAEMCALPNTLYCRDIYQYVKSYKHRGQVVVPFEEIKRVCSSKYKKFKDFDRRILAPAKKAIETCTTLRFEYEKVPGPHNRTTDIRIWFPAQQAKMAELAALQAKLAGNVAAEQVHRASVRAEFEYKPGTRIKRASGNVVLVDGHIDNLKDWLNAHRGRWEGKRGSKYLVFDYAADADSFVAACNELGIPSGKR